jgi:hypothetical protein
MASFTISKTTSKLLKNFAGISNSLLLTPGKTQKTLASSKSVFAVATLPEAWPQETGIFNLSTFLSVLSTFDKPSIEFGKAAFVLSEGQTTVQYRYSDASTIPTPPNKTLKSDDPDVTFKLPDATLTKLNKMSAVLELKAIRISVSGGDVTLTLLDTKNSSSHTITENIPSEDVNASEDAAFDIVLKQEHVALLLEGDYDVSLSGSWPYVFFQHQSEPVNYFIVAQT